MTLKNQGAAPTIPVERLRVSAIARKAADRMAGRSLRLTPSILDKPKT